MQCAPVPRIRQLRLHAEQICDQDGGTGNHHNCTRDQRFYRVVNDPVILLFLHICKTAAVLEQSAVKMGEINAGGEGSDVVPRFLN